MTFGCQMNVYDSERIAQLLIHGGYNLVDRPENADLIFMNTCTVREKPVEKAYSALGRLRKLRKKRPGLVIGVGGCMVQQDGDKIFERAPYINFLVGTKDYRNILNILNEIDSKSRELFISDVDARIDPYFFMPQSNKCSVKKPTALVSIMQGCDNFCSFCVVPYVRGREVSRPFEKILEEIQQLASHGVKEITLLGQNVNSYGQKPKGNKNFVDLLEAINNIEGIERIRFTTSHPKDLSDDLIQAFVRLPKLCEHLHLPLQSGSDRVLKEMNRGYSREDYRKKIDRIREICPEISITTDIIVGFPGESEQDFQETMAMIEEIQFDDLFSFCYCDRPFTRASSLSGKVPWEISQRRLIELQSCQRKISEKRNRSMEGQTLEVLVEGPSKHDPEENTGRTRTNRIVNFPGPLISPGTMVSVCLEKALPHSFRGRLVSRKC
jgi:tRNA-2-methylthio-N6-dimethylallyladenosine synthase